MAGVNINAGAAGNPLDALIAQHGGSMYGSVGFNLAQALSQSNSGNTGVRAQLGQFGTFGTAYDDSNTFNPNPGSGIDANGYITIDGKTYGQIGNTNIGGPGQVIDPSQAIWNDKYGVLNPVANFKGFGNDIGGWGPFALAAIPALAIVGGALAGAGGAESSSAAAFTGDISTTDLGALGTVGGEGAPAAAAGSLGAGGTAVGAGSSGTSGGLLSSLGLGGGGGTGGGILSTLNTARSGLGLVSALLGGGGGGSTGGGNMGALGSIMSLLGLGALGRQGGLFGGGVGTPGGAQNIANRAADRSDPYGASGLRTQAQQALTPGTMMQLLGLNPGGTASDITKDPGYQFALQQGTNAINVGDAAQGTLRSGNRLAELQNYGTGLAAQYEGQFRNQNLASLGALNNMAGLSSSNPAAAGADLISGFEGATSLQNAGLNGLFGNLLGGGAGGGGGLGGLLSSLGSGFSQIFGTNGIISQLFGDNSGLSDSAISDLVGSVGGGSTSDSLFGGLDIGSGFGDAFAGV